MKSVLAIVKACNTCIYYHKSSISPKCSKFIYIDKKWDYYEYNNMNDARKDLKKCGPEGKFYTPLSVEKSQ
jgi:hypothetical protein